jgi:RNA polymerase sigma-32 factor
MLNKSTVSNPSSSLPDFLKRSRDTALLSLEEEISLTEAYQSDPDGVKGRRAMDKLASSHLRLVTKVAAKYRGYGIPMCDLVSEGNVGLVIGIKKFKSDHTSKCRLNTYAAWWIRATIQEYILKNWSLVRIGTTSAQKKLFFSLRRVKLELGCMENGDLSPEMIKEISEMLGVPASDIVSMNRRIEGDLSLNSPMSSGGGEDDGVRDWQDCLTTSYDILNPEETLIEKNTLEYRRKIIKKIMKENLSKLDSDIYEMRYLQEEPATLDMVAERFGLSRERVRQRGLKAYDKVEEVFNSQFKSNL